MSELYARIKRDIVSAMKAKEADVLLALRSLDSAIRNKAIESCEKEPKDSHVLEAVAMLVKRGTDSVEQFARGGRADLVAIEQRQVDLFKAYLPAQLSEADLTARIQEAISEVGATAAADFGKVMKVIVPRVKGLADGKDVQRILRSLLP